MNDETLARSAGVLVVLLVLVRILTSRPPEPQDALVAVAIHAVPDDACPDYIPDWMMT